MIEPIYPTYEQVHPMRVALARSSLLAVTLLSFAVVAPHAFGGTQLGSGVYWLVVSTGALVTVLPPLGIAAAALLRWSRGLPDLPADALLANATQAEYAAAYVEFTLISPPERSWLIGRVRIAWEATYPEAKVVAEVRGRRIRRALSEPTELDLPPGDYRLTFTVQEEPSQPPNRYVYHFRVLSYRWLIRLAEERSIVAAMGDSLRLPLAITAPGPFGMPITSIGGVVQVVDRNSEVLSEADLADVATVESSSFLVMTVEAPRNPGSYMIRLLIRTSLLDGRIELPLVVSNLRREELR